MYTIRDFLCWTGCGSFYLFHFVLLTEYFLQTYEVFSTYSSDTGIAYKYIFVYMAPNILFLQYNFLISYDATNVTNHNK